MTSMETDEFDWSSSDDDYEEEEVDKKTSVCKKQIVAAIDFGTAYSGYAYSFKNDWTKVITHPWHGGEYMTHKAPTTLLLTPKGEFCQFGFKAEKEYAELAENEKHEPYYFFRRFKLILKPKLTERVNRETVCADENGKEFNALKIFTFCIDYLKTNLLEDINKTIKGEVALKDIQFIITVPAIWDDTAKMFMIEAAKTTGIQKDQLTVVLESEAASVYCQYMYLEEDKAKLRRYFQDKLIPGFKYMVIDLGGGTADISVHRRDFDGSVEQVIKPSGISWGGTKVDDAYWDFFCDLFGEESMDTFKKECTEDYLDFFRKFEVQKRSGKLTTSDNLYIRIPLSLSEILEEKFKKGIAEAVSKSKYRDIITFDSKTFKLKLPFSQFENLFKVTSDHIIAHLEELWKKPELADVSTVLCVGGFSECYIIRDRIRSLMNAKSLRPKENLVLPDDPSLAVLKGAVYMGHVPDAVTTRISNYTYGIQNWPNFDPAKHPEDKKIMVANEPRCKDVFKKFITRGDKLKSKYPKTFILEVLKPVEDFLDCSVYISQKDDPKFIDEEGVSRVGTLRVTLPKVEKGTVIDIEEEISIQDTEVEILCRELHKFKEFKGAYDLLNPEILKKK